MDDMEIKKAFDEINISTDDMKERVSKSIKKNCRPKRAKRPRVIALACVCLLAITVFSQGAIVFAKEVVIPWTKAIMVGDEQAEITGEYLALNKDANTKDAKYDTLGDIEKILGINLLQSTVAYEASKGMVIYTPYLEGNKMLGVNLKDHQYAIGDLEDVKIDSQVDDISLVPSVRYKDGDKYKSAITCEIIIRSDAKPSEKYENKELQYTPDEWYSSDGTEPEIYENDLGVPILIYNANLDWGPSFSSDSKNKLVKSTFAQFAYKGIEYIYYGAVSKNTMKEFINTLH